MKKEQKSLKVIVAHGSSDSALESALNLLKKKVNDAGVYESYMRTQEFEKPSVRRRNKKKAATRSAKKFLKEKRDNIEKLLKKCVVG